MDILKHPCCTRDLGAPNDIQDGSCASLPVYEQQDRYGPWSVSFWKPSPEELAILNDGGCLSLHVRAIGRQHPVVAMGIQSKEFASQAVKVV